MFLWVLNKKKISLKDFCRIILIGEYIKTRLEQFNQ